jgi:hypothetical protein
MRRGTPSIGDPRGLCKIDLQDLVRKFKDKTTGKCFVAGIPLRYGFDLDENGRVVDPKFLNFDLVAAPDSPETSYLVLSDPVRVTLHLEPEDLIYGAAAASMFLAEGRGNHAIVPFDEHEEYYVCPNRGGGLSVTRVTEAVVMPPPRRRRSRSLAWLNGSVVTVSSKYHVLVFLARMIGPRHPLQSRSARSALRSMTPRGG